MKRSIHQDIAILNVYTPNNRATNHMKRKLIELKGEIGKSTIIGGGFNISLSTTVRTTRQKIRKNIDKLSNTIN